MCEDISVASNRPENGADTVKRALPLRTSEVERLRQELGLTLDTLARRAAVDVRTLKRWLKGEPAFIENIARLATTLGTSADSIIDREPQAITPPETLDAEFRVSLRVAGTLTSRAQLAKLASLRQSVVDSLAAAGITVNWHDQELLVADDEGMSICYYVSTDREGRHTWYVLAAPISKRDELCAATQRADGVDVRQYGEVISSGRGSDVPKEIRALLHRTYPAAILPP